MIKNKTICYADNPCNGYYGKCLDVKITNACNGSCRFCIEKNGYRPDNIPVERLIEITNSLEDYQKVLILGGEPFLYPNLIEYLEGIKNKEEIYITTNGSLFHKWPLDKIAQYLTAVNISIHHYSQAGASSALGTLLDFIEIYLAIKQFKAAGVKVRINTNLIKGVLNDYTDIQLMISAAKNLGADEIRFAELQHCSELYVSAENLFGGMLNIKLPDEPFSSGCEHLISDEKDFAVRLRLACGLVNPNRVPPSCPERKGSMTKVMYPDGTLSNGWLTPAKTEYIKNTFGWDCHSRNSCH